MQNNFALSLDDGVCFLRAIIFGANGQDGYYLTEMLHEKKIETVTISRNSGDFVGNVSNYSFVENQIKYFQPAYIFHLVEINNKA